MTEPTETIELSEADVVDLASLGMTPDGEEPSYHTILEVWREVLKPAAAEGRKPVTPQWANRMVSAYAGIEFKDMNTFRDLYFDRLEDLLDLVLLEINTDPDCLSYVSSEEDVAQNSHHYKALLFDWQKKILSWELGWDCTSPTAAVELGVLSEVHKVFFGPTGLTQFLDNIKYEFTDSDQAELAQTLDEVRSASEAGSE